MAIKKNDFIEIEFTGKLKDSEEIFDTNIKSDAEKSDLNIKDIKPFKMAVGHKMLPSGFDEDLVGKKPGKEYSVELTPEKAFGKRNPQMVRMIPTKHFIEQQINPVRGMQLSLDGQLVKILSSDRGRTLVDFNNPLAGRAVVYNYKINKEITDENEKVDALQDFLFRQKFNYTIKDKTITFEASKEFEPFVKMIGPKFEEILGLKVETKVVEEKPAKEEKKE